MYACEWYRLQNTHECIYACLSVSYAPFIIIFLKQIYYLLLYRLVASALDAMFLKGDVIAIDMPMTVTAVIIYLAIVYVGLVVVAIADSFAPKEIATRLRVSKAKAIFTQVKT